MGNILLVEPDYPSKFPPLGLMKIATYHKEKGDAVTFVRGKIPSMREAKWNKVYVSSLFTYELPRTVSTLRYYRPAVDNPMDLIVGGIGVTLYPDYVRKRVDCRIVEGPLTAVGSLDNERVPIAYMTPDYSILKSVTWKYRPDDAYFCRATVGCVRRCTFCAVPRLEPHFGFFRSVAEQVRDVLHRFGEKQHLVMLDNNVLAVESFAHIIDEIADIGFYRGARRNNKQRTVDFTQAIDARLIDNHTAKLLGRIALSPVRLAFDYDGMEPFYRRAIQLLVAEGFREFVTYIMYNFEDTPLSFYHRMSVNVALSSQYGVRITGFPMRYVPVESVSRRHVGPRWRWRYLRGVQCVLNATHGVVSPNPSFFKAAFGGTFEEFIEIVSMPDHYILYRREYAEQAHEWRCAFRKLEPAERERFLDLLDELHSNPQGTSTSGLSRSFRALLAHYTHTRKREPGSRSDRGSPQDRWKSEATSLPRPERSNQHRSSKRSSL